jgi:hypothetical protein
MKVVIAAVLFAHGIGHVMGPLQVLKVAVINPTWTGESWMLTGVAGTTVSQVIGVVLWATALVGFVARQRSSSAGCLRPGGCHSRSFRPSRRSWRSHCSRTRSRHPARSQPSSSTSPSSRRSCGSAGRRVPWPGREVLERSCREVSPVFDSQTPRRCKEGRERQRVSTIRRRGDLKRI